MPCVHFSKGGFQSWNQKNLDYEIETSVITSSVKTLSSKKLEMKSISITRLKLFIFGAKYGLKRYHAWNEKHLDYEIETQVVSLKLKDTSTTFGSSWNEKHLDYEIETLFVILTNMDKIASLSLEMKSISITRLKHILVKCLSASLTWTVPLEMKSISITRLKRCKAFMHTIA